MPKLGRVLPVSLSIILTALLVAIALTVFGRTHDRVAAVPTPADTSPRSEGSAGPPSHLPSFPTTQELLLDRQMDSAAVEQFRSYAAYPPDSRPLVGNEADVLAPFGFPPVPITVDGATCALHPALHTVAEGQTNLVSLFCVDPRDPQRRLPLLIHDATVTSGPASAGVAAGGAGAPPPARPVAFNDAGRDGDAHPSDNVYTWTFVPTPADVGDVNVTVRFALAGGAGPVGTGGDAAAVDLSSRVREMRANFLSSPVAPARFTGRIRDSLVQGSLLVEVELDVQRAGRFQIAANLYAGDRPIGYATGESKLEAGRRSIPLRFFGKMFGDRLPTARSGSPTTAAFELVALRGTRLNLPFDPVELAALPPSEIARAVEAASPVTGPEREPIPPWPERIRTHPYVLSQFSSDEWRSPVKDRRLAELRESADTGDFGRR